MPEDSSNPSPNSLEPVRNRIVGAAVLLIVVALIIWAGFTWFSPKPPEWLSLPASYEVKEEKVLWSGDGFEGPDLFWVIHSPEPVRQTATRIRQQLASKFGDVDHDKESDGSVVFMFDGGTRKIVVTVRPDTKGSLVKIEDSTGL